MTLGPFTEKHSFLLCDTAVVNLLGSDLLSKLKELINFASNGDLTLECPDQPEPDLLCSLQSVLDTEEEEFQQKTSNLIEVPENLWATSNTDTGRIRSAEPIKIRRDITKPLPKLPQYPLKPKTTQGFIPIIEDQFTKGLMIPCTSPCNTWSYQSQNLMGGDGDLSRT